MIGERIQAALKMRNMKQKELASKLLVTDNTISYFCSNKRRPRESQIAQIAIALNVTSDYLLGLDDCPTRHADTQSFCTLSGLSEHSIKQLCELQKQGHTSKLKAIENMVDWIYND